MFSTFSLPFSGWLRTSGRSKVAIDLPPVQVHELDKINEPAARRLKHLLKANHAKYSIIYHDLTFHNHTPHFLGSAYILGATPAELDKAYEEESKQHEQWKPSPGEISKEDWRDFLGKREYQRAFVDFYEDQLAAVGYDWKLLLEQYLYEGEHPLINSVVSGLGHPLIHLGYAYELDSQDIAIETLSHASCFYDQLHKYLDDPSYTRPASYTSKSPLEILQKVAEDPELDEACKDQGMDQHEKILKTHEKIILDHWNAWQVNDDPKTQFAASQRAAAALIVATRQPGEDYDFFLLHTLTSSHAVRVLLPIVPAKFQVPLVRQWFLFALLTYVGQKRPKIDMDIIEKLPLKDKSWKYVDHAALHAKQSDDVHYVKGLRALHNAADTWGDKDRYFLKAAVGFSENFGGWGGWGSGPAQHY